MFKIFRRGEDSEKDLPPSEDPEKGPDDETLERIRQIDETIAKSDELLGGLDRLAKEKIFSSQGSPEYDEIYAPKEIGRGELGSEDAWAFEPAGKGLAVRNAIWRTLGLAGSKYALERQAGVTAEGSLVDTRKLKEKVKKDMTVPGGIELEEPELKEVAKKLGLDAAKMDTNKYGKKYQEGKRAESKIYLSDRTKEEIEETAGEILTRRLAELESNGRELVKERQGLERFNKEVDSTEGSFKGAPDGAKILAGFEEERAKRTAGIDKKQAELMSGESGIEVIRQPLLNRQEDLNKAVAELSPLLKDVLAQEEAYKTGKKSLRDKMNKVRQTQEVSQMEDVKTIMAQWQGEEEQVDINSAGFREEKEKLNLRITDLRRGQVEVGRMLARINKIGKTGEDLTAEEQAKKKKKPTEQVKKKISRPKKVTGQPKEELPIEPGVSDKWSDNAPEGIPTRRKEPAPQPEGKKDAGEAANQIYQALVAEERKKVELDQQPSGAEQSVVKRKVSIGEFVRGWFKPKGGMRGPDTQLGAEVTAAVAPTADRNAPKPATEAMPPSTEPGGDGGDTTEDKVQAGGNVAASTEAVVGVPKTGEIKPEPKVEIKKSEDKTAAGVASGEKLKDSLEIERIATEKREQVKMAVEVWRENIFSKNDSYNYDEIIKHYFKKGSTYMKTTEMTGEEILICFINFLEDRKTFRMIRRRAWAVASEKINSIVALMNGDRNEAGKAAKPEAEKPVDAPRQVRTPGTASAARKSAPRRPIKVEPLGNEPPADFGEIMDKANSAAGTAPNAGEGKKPKDQRKPKAGATPDTAGSSEKPKISADELLNALGANGDQAWANQEEKLKVEAGAMPDKVEDKEEPRAGTPTALTAEPVALDSESGSGVERERARANKKRRPENGETKSARNWMAKFGLRKGDKVAEGYFVPQGKDRKFLITEEEAIESYVKWAVEAMYLKEEDARKEVEGFFE